METPKPAGIRQSNNPSQLETLRKPPAGSVTYELRLFIAGNEPNSAIARKNLEKISSDHPLGNFHLEVIDVFENFTAALEENILVTPALIIVKPKKMKIYGNLQDRDKVLFALGLL